MLLEGHEFLRLRESSPNGDVRESRRLWATDRHPSPKGAAIYILPWGLAPRNWKIMFLEGCEFRRLCGRNLMVTTREPRRLQATGRHPSPKGAAIGILPSGLAPRN